uniref:Uncharacterized protein n=1 Tax=Arundo donax TaxID=35708 RepID=A0A0A9BWS2_ARUDO
MRLSRSRFQHFTGGGGKKEREMKPKQ